MVKVDGANDPAGAGQGFAPKQELRIAESAGHSLWNCGHVHRGRAPADLAVRDSNTRERKFEDMVKSAERAVVLVLVY